MCIRYEDVLIRLKQERLRMQWTQKTVSKKLGMTQSHYSKAELGMKRFSYREMQSLNQIGVDVHYIFTGQKESLERYEALFKECGRQELLCIASIFCALKDYLNRKNTEGGVQSVGRQTEPFRYLFAAEDDKRSIWYLLRAFYDYTQKEMAVLMEIDIKKYRSLEREEILPDSEIILTAYNQFHIPPLLLLEDYRGMFCEMPGLDLEKQERILEYLKEGYALITGDGED